MNIYMNTWFARWIKNQDISVLTLRHAVQEMQAGLIDAHLGSGIIKKRMARPGGGKSGGYRTILATNYRDQWIYIFGFEKNGRDNITASELKALKDMSTYLLSMDQTEIDKAIKNKKLIKV